MRKRVAERVDYRGLLGAMGERGEAALAALDDLEGAVEERRVGYVSVVASASRWTRVVLPAPGCRWRYRSRFTVS
jgi:hypothetical protein